jgi:hypothetical protein
VGPEPSENQIILFTKQIIDLNGKKQRREERKWEKIREMSDD